MKGKTALITGASSGIGRELARIHAENGGSLIIVARRTENLRALKAELEDRHGVDVMVIAKDLTLPGAARELFNEVQAAGREVDYLINNAGFGGLGKFHEQNPEYILSMLNLNIIALTELTRLFLPGFVERNSGSILNISSIASLIPGPMQAVYHASKAYVTSFSNAIAEELSDTNIRVSALLPGATRTEFASTADLESTTMFKNAFDVRGVARDGYRAMIAGRLNKITAASAGRRISLVLLPFVPKKMVLKMMRRMAEEN